MTIKNGGKNNMAARPEVVCRMKKIKPESFLGGQGLSDIHILILLWPNFTKFEKFWPDDVIPKTVDIDGSTSNTIIDIP